MSDSSDDRRAAIERAARAVFERRGYAAATVRSISSAAGVGPSVLASYYRNKAELFAAVMDLPFDPASAIPRLVAPGLDGMGERLVRLALRAAEDEQVRSDIGSLAPGVPEAFNATPGAVRALWEFVSGEVVDQVLVLAGIPDAKMRGALITSYLGGILVARYAAHIEPLASASEDEVVALVAPTIQTLLDPTRPLPGGSPGKLAGTSSGK
jgi:AcrR family transcriptional regulator